MIKVIIADADEENRKNFRTYIKLQKKDFTIVRTLEAGNDVLVVAADTKPDLLIADIRFFGPSSIATITKLHAYHPNLLIILYGSYNDYDYFEKMAETGVVTYMYKPVKTAELGRHMDRIAHQIKQNAAYRREKELLMTSYKQALPIFEDRFLINLIHGQIDSELEFLEAADYFNFRIVPPYRVFIVKIDQFKKVSLALDQNEKQLLVYSILRQVNLALDQWHNGVAFINHISSVTAIFGGGVTLDALLEQLEQLKDNINREIKLSISIGVGRAYDRGSDIQVSYKQAKSALRYRHVVGAYSVIPIDFVEPENILTYKYPHKKEELLTYSAVVGDLRRTNGYLNDIFTALRESGGEIPERLIPNIIVDIAISINRYVAEQKNLDQSIVSNIFSIKDALKVQTIDEGYDYLHESLTKLCMQIDRARKSREAEIITKVEAYVGAHFAENISLPETAKVFGCVPEYLNSIFLKHRNITYYDLVMQYRMAVAKNLLERNEMTDETIAEFIGYKDAKYFKSIFLQQEGLSVTEYRDLHQRGAL